MKKTFFILLLMLVTGIAKAVITTPYPEIIEIKQINGAEKERLRLCQAQKKYDKQPTGFYVEAGKTVKLNLEILTAADKGVMPVLTVGTMGFNVDGRNTGTHFTLKSGINTITDHQGGLIWLSFIQNESDEPKGVAKITFTTESEHVRAPRFVFQTTTAAEFKEMMDTYQTPDVLYQSDYALIVSTREAAITYTYPTNINKVSWIKSIHTLMEKEDEISGLDNNDPNPVHHRLKAGEVRHLLVENTSASPHASSAGYTGYPSASRNRYLTELGTSSNNTWMLGHEIGHQHQQSAYLINKATESTVNIYSYVVERNIQGASYNRTSTARWTGAKSTYLQLPFSKRIYDMEDSKLEGIVGFNRDELRFMPWEQLFLIFGDEFYHTLHRVVREEKVTGGTAEERRAYLIWKASQLSGYDLTEFFNIWGIRVSDSKIKADLRAKMAYAKSQSTILDLSAIDLTAQNLVAVTGQSRPEWTPIALRGITTGEASTAEVLSRSTWSVTTSHNGPTDTAIGGDSPDYIIDDDSNTAFAFVKAGKSYGGITVPAGEELWFTIDMGEQKGFNYVEYTHRLGNTAEQIRARQFSILGSNNGTQFSPIKEHYKVDYEKNANVLLVSFPAVSYRYIKVLIEDWNHDAGSTVQVADFKAGTMTKIEYPTPDPLKFNVSVAVDEGIVCSQEGVNKADEDSDYTINFTLAPNKKDPTATVDGEEFALTKNDAVYSLTVKVSNHLNVNITSLDGGSSGIGTISNNPEIKFYPNPVKAGQTFSIDGDFSNAVASIYNLSGMKIFETELEENTICIEQQGVYILKIQKASQVSQAKIIVK